MPDLVHRRLRAPQEDGAALIDPPLEQTRQLIEQNRQAGAEFDRLAGFPTGFRARARKSLIASGEQRDSNAASASANPPLILTGHQPELFHPGVWFKNFLASAIATAEHGKAINLVIDNDVIRSTNIRVPGGAGLLQNLIPVPFDAPAEGSTWECHWIRTEQTFRNFAAEVNRVFEPQRRGTAYRQGMILDRLWPLAVAAMEAQQKRAKELVRATAIETDREIPPGLFERPNWIAKLGHSLSVSRVALERELGLTIYDYPIHEFGIKTSFLQFADLLFARHRELHAIHNVALAEYRHLNHIRSHSHPFPELAREDDWFELPFWISSSSDRERRRLFLRSVSDDWEFTDRKSIRLRAAKAESSAWWGIMWRNQVDLRPRALITTMYARLVLSDLFIHGIGGAKYDELTDLIIRRFFGIEPPAYVTATATFRLPIERPQVTLGDVRKSARRIRETRYRPEAFVRDPLVKQDATLGEQLTSLAAEKRGYLAKHDLRHCSPEVFAALDRLNRAMHDLLRPVEEQLRAEHAQLVEQAKQTQLLSSREFSFCLFPSEILPARLLDLCKVSS